MVVIVGEGDKSRGDVACETCDDVACETTSDDDRGRLIGGGLIESD